MGDTIGTQVYVWRAQIHITEQIQTNQYIVNEHTHMNIHYNLHVAYNMMLCNIPFKKAVEMYYHHYLSKLIAMVLPS